MSVNGVGSTSSLMVQAVVDMRARLEELQRQLGTGRKSETYAGVGLDRGLAVGLRTRLSAVDSYTDTIKTLNMRMDLAQTALTRIDDLSKSVRSSARLSGYDLDNTGQTTEQKNARIQLDAVLGLLTTQAGDRYLFSGRSGDLPPVETANHILDGDGVRAGLKQLIAERNQADLGASGLGRLVAGGAGPVVSVAEDVAGSPFGFKLASVTSTLTNAVVTGPAGAPPGISVDFTAGNPNPGDRITVTLTLPDGTSENIILTATASGAPKPGEFTIGATTTDTADNLRSVMTSHIGELGRTALSAASALAASNDFFNIDAANPPRRVAGPPFDTATALTAGTTADTVFWYTGEAGSDPARQTAVARVDEVLTVPYGLRANEQAPRVSVQNIAAFAALTSSATDPDGEARYQAFTQRNGANL